jgi:hypothetical protein
MVCFPQGAIWNHPRKVHSTADHFGQACHLGLHRLEQSGTEFAWNPMGSRMVMAKSME